MTKEEYAEYLQSEHWKGLRKQRLELDGYQCQKCGAKHKLQVHHTRYSARLEDTPVTDLLTLCDICHARAHGKLPKSKARRIAKAKRKALKKLLNKRFPGPKWKLKRLRIQRDQSSSNSHWIIFPRNVGDYRGVLGQSKSS